MNDFHVQEISLLALHLSGECYKEKYRPFLFARFEEDKTLDAVFLFQMLYDKKTANDLREHAKQVLQTCINHNIFVITILDSRYPELLKETKNPPLVFFAQGNVELLKKPSISMVGTRRPSAMGAFLAQVTAKYFAQERVIVSGMALGIDAVCHHAAMQKNATIGVVAQGFFHRYPSANSQLYQMAAENHEAILLISEYSPQTSPQRFHFPRRNRIIAGLSPLTIFAEGGIKSGANITVNYALEQGRDVAVIHHPQMLNNEGGKRWLEQGAPNLLDVMHTESGAQEDKKLLDKLQDESTVYLGNGNWFSASFL